MPGRLILTPVVALVLLLAGCHAERNGEPAPLSRASVSRSGWVKTELYFGLGKPDGSEVNTAEWDAFLAGDVTPRFPDGLTVMDACGQWRNASGTVVREKSKLLILIHETGPDKDRAIEELRAIYKERFHQESVLRVRHPVEVSF